MADGSHLEFSETSWKVKQQEKGVAKAKSVGLVSVKVVPSGIFMIN